MDISEAFRALLREAGLKDEAIDQMRPDELPDLSALLEALVEGLPITAQEVAAGLFTEPDEETSTGEASPVT